MADGSNRDRLLLSCLLLLGGCPSNHDCDRQEYAVLYSRCPRRLNGNDALWFDQEPIRLTPAGEADPPDDPGAAAAAPDVVLLNAERLTEKDKFRPASDVQVDVELRICNPAACDAADSIDASRDEICPVGDGPECVRCAPPPDPGACAACLAEHDGETASCDMCGFESDRPVESLVSLVSLEPTTEAADGEAATNPDCTLQGPRAATCITDFQGKARLGVRAKVAQTRGPYYLLLRSGPQCRAAQIHVGPDLGDMQIEARLSGPVGAAPENGCEDEHAADWYVAAAPPTTLSCGTAALGCDRVQSTTVSLSLRRGGAPLVLSSPITVELELVKGAESSPSAKAWLGESCDTGGLQHMSVELGKEPRQVTLCTNGAPGVYELNASRADPSGGDLLELEPSITLRTGATVGSLLYQQTESGARVTALDCEGHGVPEALIELQPDPPAEVSDQLVRTECDGTLDIGIEGTYGDGPLYLRAKAVEVGQSCSFEIRVDSPGESSSDGTTSAGSSSDGSSSGTGGGT